MVREQGAGERWGGKGYESMKAYRETFEERWRNRIKNRDGEETDRN